MRQAMTQARRHDRATGVMFLDLDRFKLANDTLRPQRGRPAAETGRRAPRQLRARRRHCGPLRRRRIRDHALRTCAVTEDARLVAQKVLDVLQSPFVLEGHEVFITASIGISLYPGDSDDETELMKNADAAMYRAKESGRNQLRVLLQGNERALAAALATSRATCAAHWSGESSCSIISPRRASPPGRSPASRRCCAGRRADRSLFRRPTSCRCSRTPD